MISRLKGKLWEVGPLKIVVDVGGVGYEVAVPLSASERLPKVGEAVELFIRSIYREDSAALYGFPTVAERDFFGLLIDKVTGMGPKTALALLSKATPDRIWAAIDAGDVASLSATPGIGKKTAERLVLELKGQLAGLAVGGGSRPTGEVADAVAALQCLGFSAAEAAKAIAKAAEVLGAAASADALIKTALKK